MVDFQTRNFSWPDRLAVLQRLEAKVSRSSLGTGDIVFVPGSTAVIPTEITDSTTNSFLGRSIGSVWR